MHRHPRMHDSREIGLATLDDELMGVLSNYVMHNWLLTKSEVQKEAWSPDEIVVIDEIIMKGRRGIIMPTSM